MSEPPSGNRRGMVLRVFLASVVAIVALSALGLWITEVRSDETRLASFYLVAVGIGTAAVILGLLAIRGARSRRP